jgi:hypothetical protein
MKTLIAITLMATGSALAEPVLWYDDPWLNEMVIKQEIRKVQEEADWKLRQLERKQEEALRELRSEQEKINNDR